MWASIAYLLPVATVLSKIIVDDEIIFDGDLYQELNTLVFRYVPANLLVLLPNPELKATSNFRFPAKTNMWSVMDSILMRYHLTIELGSTREGALTVKLKEGAAWRR